MSVYELDFCSDSVAIPASSVAAAISHDNGQRAGDIIMRAVCIVSDVQNCRVQVRDGANGTDIDIAGQFEVPGTYTVQLGIKSSNVGAGLNQAAGWFATTGSGVKVLFVGRFR